MAKVFRNAELERRVQERIWVRLAKGHETRIRRAMVAQYRDAAKKVERGITPETVDGSRLEKAIEGIMRDGFEQIGQRTARAIKETQGKAGKRRVEMSPEFEEGMNKYIRLYAGRKVVEVDSVTKARIARLVQKGIDEGWSQTETAQAIREAGLIDSAYRSNVIARTESHAAANAGSLESAQESGVVQEKEWIFTEDERTRDGTESEFDHTNVANVPVDQPFIVSGEELMYPGDPSGSAGNIINCRCAVGYVV
jgi:hypothetical protein